MNNLGFHTDLIFLEEERQIIKFPNYLFVRSPNQPNYYFGNYLLLNGPPEYYNKAALENIFIQRFKDKRINHFTFCWSGDVKKGIQPFLDAGYELDELTVLKVRKENLKKPQQRNNEIEIRAFRDDQDWKDWIQLEHEGLKKGTEEVFLSYIQGRAKVYQKLALQNKGNFYGAYVNNALVAAAGLFHDGKIGRFQSVRTKASFQRKGICKSLVYEISKNSLQKIDKLVIAADKGYHALDLYRKLGFQDAASQTSIYWYPK